MPAMKTPGVYIVEKSAFPNSVVEVATAVPAFIGYTQIAMNGSKILKNIPWRISSMAEFHKYYGFGPEPVFDIRDAVEGEEASFVQDGQAKYIEQISQKYNLYYSMRMFYQNGGGPCYVVSVGDYSEDIEQGPLAAGIATLEKEQEPTMVVVPEAVSLPEAAQCIAVQQVSLQHCGGKMRNRVSILDIYDGFKDRQDPAGDVVTEFRSALGINYLDFAMAYYPWINATIIQDSELSFDVFKDKALLIETLSKELKVAEETDDKGLAAQRAAYKVELEKIADKGDGPLSAEQEAERTLLNKTLAAISPLYVELIKDIRLKLNVLPPSAAMAGVYTMVDNSRGVWKAPANVSLAAVTTPIVSITHDEQEDLNVTSQGKSINAIRSFIGEGTLVWGARTLDGNSLDWRYISVRRTMIMLEESIRLSTKAYVFDANTAQTWVTVKSMIQNFLTSIWKRGGLAGSSPDDAFSVHVGLGETMTPDDILEGILRVSVFVAITRPAEFIEITFTQQMQKS
ncbi:MAG TPA: phage tail sheath family protein [Gammaproteobacteria bacterium]|nr:phage tail sheath family protein [Gammaproteobacteria bacterium]